jgi:putative ABC transport system ATP-binding protein
MNRTCISEARVQTKLGASPVIRFKRVIKDYLADREIVHALNGVDLEIGTGELIALVGRSGCGKSTLLNLAGAMDFPTSGEVWIEEKITSSLGDAALTALRREKVGFIFQSFQLLHTLSVIENVELPLLLAGKSSARAIARQRLEWVELQELGSRLPHQLSGGQMQRVAVARALVHDPRVILADEPTGNLDSTTGNTILELLRRVSSELHAAVIMATHSMEAAAIADKIILMRDGQIQQSTVR